MLKDLIIKGGWHNDLAFINAETVCTSIFTYPGVGEDCVGIGDHDGIILRSVIIKAELPDGANPLTYNPGGPGIISMYINGSLYQEILIPVSPALPCTPLPIPVLPTFEIRLPLELELQSDAVVCFYTQTAYKLNIIYEYLSWDNLESVGPTCSAFMLERATTGGGIIASSDVAGIFTADPDADGTYIKSITIKALQSTHEGMIKLYIDGTYLYKEISIPATNQSAFEPSFKYVLEPDIFLGAGTTISASTTNAESFALTVEGISWAMTYNT